MGATWCKTWSGIDDVINAIADDRQYRGIKVASTLTIENGETVWWGVWTDREGVNFITCDIILSEGGERGYRSYGEEEFPYYYSCPLKYLKVSKIINWEWRKLVRQYHRYQKNMEVRDEG